MFSACIFLHKIILHFEYYFHFLNAKVIQSFGCISGYNIHKSLLSEENMKSRQKKEESMLQQKKSIKYLTSKMKYG